MQQFFNENSLTIIIFFSLLANSLCIIKIWFSNKFFQISNPVEAKEYKRSEGFSIISYFVILATILYGMYLTALLASYLK